MASEDQVGRVAFLDGTRGLAVLMVLGCHLLGPMPDVGIVPKIIQHVSAYGSLGVDVFFLLSGYLITGILLRSRNDEHYYRNFYARRVLRIFPLHYATLLIVLVVAPGVSMHARQELAPTIHHQGWAWLYAVNFFYLFHPGSDLRYVAHFWSLAVEEHFYFIWPLAVRSWSPRSLGRASLVIALLSCVARMVAPAAGINIVATSMLTPLRLDTLCLGALVAVWSFENRQRRLGLAAGLVGGTALALGVATIIAQRLAPSLTELARALRGSGSRALLWAGFMGLLASGPRSFARRLLSTPVLRFFGKYSYGLYVFHAILGLAAFRGHMVEKLASHVGSFPVALGIVAAVVVFMSVLIAMMSYRYLEAPFLALKTWFQSDVTTTPSIATASGARPFTPPIPFRPSEALPPYAGIRSAEDPAHRREAASRTPRGTEGAPLVNVIR